MSLVREGPGSSSPAAQLCLASPRGAILPGNPSTWPSRTSCPFSFRHVHWSRTQSRLPSNSTIVPSAVIVSPGRTGARNRKSMRVAMKPHRPPRCVS